MDVRSFVVVGVCVPERRAYARALERLLGAPLMFEPGGPRHGAREASRWSSFETVVLEAATDVDVAHLLGGGEVSPCVVCVVDAPHFIDDLCSGEALIDDAAPGDDRGDPGARARQAAHFVEAASVVVFVNWERLDTSRLSELMALASHLSPTARIRLAHSAERDIRGIDSRGVWQERAGWLRALNAEHDPYMVDPAVGTFRYEQLRPFHPGRLATVLERELGPERVGLVVRSVGLCRLATRVNTLARWEHVGSSIWIDPLPADEGWDATNQEIVFTGMRLSGERIEAALDSAALTDAELVAGPSAWRGFADPLPRWPMDRDEPRGAI